ncbi:MAG TPA: hypothetical protein VF173_28430 [Thermoanaerobaculia bacterium]|nr:hypothetical protein [Thermoanaerobaculia bacterium]
MASTINPTAFNTSFNAIALDANASRLSTSFVDVSLDAPPPTIVRDGKAVAPPAFNPALVDDLIAHTVPLVRTQVPVAVSQSIPAGTRVAKGTPVDLVLMPVTQIPFTVFTQFHPDLATKNVSDLLPVVADPQVAPLLDLDPATLTAAQKTVITTALTAKGVNVVETDTSRNFASAFQSLQSVRVFV